MKILKLTVYALSPVCLLLALREDPSPIAVLGTIPFWILLGTGFHEGGHCLGCLMVGNPIREVRLPLFAVSEGRLILTPGLWPVSYCRFQRSGRDWPVYLMGPAASALLWCGLLLLWLALRYAALMAGCILAFLILAVNIIPVGQNDAAMILREIQHRNENR